MFITTNSSEQIVFGKNSTFNGTTIADLGTVTQNNGFVSAWLDKSLNGHHLIQADHKRRPLTSVDSINGLNTLTFSSIANTGLKLKSGIDWGSIYIVMKCLIVQNKKVSVIGTVLQFNDENGDGKPDLVRNNTDYFINGSKNNDAGLLLTPALLARKSQFINTILDVGVNEFDKNFGLDGNIAEIICLRADVSAQDQSRVEGYLAHKWGLQELLPETHFYKFEAPK